MIKKIQCLQCAQPALHENAAHRFCQKIWHHKKGTNYFFFIFLYLLYSITVFGFDKRATFPKANSCISGSGSLTIPSADLLLAILSASS